MVYRAYAKINIGLRILEKRPDGFHNIETVFHRIALFDEIELRPASWITVSSTDPAAPDGEQNLCFRAAQSLQRHLRCTEGVEIKIQKNVPVRAGLGGGSADAGLALRELPKLWGLTVDESQLSSLALNLGSDVSYFLRRGSAYATGRGEVLEYFDLDVPYTILLCIPGIAISSAWAYRQVSPRGCRHPHDLRTVVTVGMKDPSRLREEALNDFEPAAFSAYPALLEIKETMYGLGAAFASMSGSGSSMFGMFSSTPDAEKVSRHLAGKGYHSAITPSHFMPQ